MSGGAWCVVAIGVVRRIFWCGAAFGFVLPRPRRAVVAGRSGPGWRPRREERTRGVSSPSKGTKQIDRLRYAYFLEAAVSSVLILPKKQRKSVVCRFSCALSGKTRGVSRGSCELFGESRGVSKTGCRGASKSRQMRTKKRDLSSRLKTNPVCEWGKWGELLSPLSVFAAV